MADPATLLAIAAIGAVGAAGVSAAGSIYGGLKAQETAEIIARQEEQMGKDAQAESQREARERAFEAKLVMSRQQAIAAASGAGAGTDAPSIVTLMQKTAERAQYGQDVARYGGDVRRDRLYSSAAARRRTGQNEFIGSVFDAAGSLAGGIGRFAEIRA